MPPLWLTILNSLGSPPFFLISLTPIVTHTQITVLSSVHHINEIQINDEAYERRWRRPCHR